MNLVAENVGKKYGKQWIFRKLNFEISPGSPTAITGKNGSGKSTLLKIISGYLAASEGSVTTIDEDMPISFVSPDTEIIEDLSLKEFYDFHASFRSPSKNLHDLAKEAGLPINKPIGDFSSGMKQRAKLSTAFFFENDFYFYDEPTINLDREGIRWFRKKFYNKRNKINVIASNISEEVALCEGKVVL